MKLREACAKFISRSGFAAIASVLALTTGVVGVVSVAQTPPVAAASCTVQDDFPDTNIIYCGLSGGSNVDQLASSFKAYYNNNDDGHGHTDLQAVYNAAGLSNSMFTSGSWHLGTSFDNDTIVVDNNVVGTNVYISSRCSSGMTNCQPANKYTHLKDKNGNTVSNVYTRDASWFFDKDKNGNPIHSQPTLVHLNANNQADFAVWTHCGNVLTFTPKEMPKKALVCVSLTKEADSTLQFTFTAKASAQNETIQSYVFDFGDNNTQTVTTSNTTATSKSHTYSQTDVEQDLTAKVSVNGSNDTNVTSSNCQTTVTIPPKQEKKPALACVSLKPTTTDNKTFTFTAAAQTTGQSFTSYTFDFGDGNSQTQSNNVSQHTYAHPGTFTASFTATSPDGTTMLIDACKASVTVPTPPPVLPNTGAGDIVGIFSLASVAGGIFYQLVLRKKLQA